MTEAPAKAAPRKQVPPSGKLTPSEVTDTRDNAPRLKDDLSGKRVRAIPAFVGQLLSGLQNKTLRNTKSITLLSNSISVRINSLFQ